MAPLFLDHNLTSLDWLEHGFGTIASAEAHWPPAPLTASLKQTHSAIALRAFHPGLLGEGDALVTNHPALFVSIRTADCVPILLADVTNRAVAAIHAGWRGSAANIAAQTLALMNREFGTDPADLQAAIGPCIQQCCYQVSAEVAHQFEPWIPHYVIDDRKVMLDLVSVNRAQLRAAGVLPHNISTIPECTKCNDRHLHSFRRDADRAGRQVSAIRIRPI